MFIDMSSQVTFFSMRISFGKDISTGEMAISLFSLICNAQLISSQIESEWNSRLGYLFAVVNYQGVTSPTDY